MMGKRKPFYQVEADVTGKPKRLPKGVTFVGYVDGTAIFRIDPDREENGVLCTSRYSAASIIADMPEVNTEQLITVYYDNNPADPWFFRVGPHGNMIRDEESYV